MYCLPCEITTKLNIMTLPPASAFPWERARVGGEKDARLQWVFAVDETWIHVLLSIRYACICLNRKQTPSSIRLEDVVSGIFLLEKGLNMHFNGSRHTGKLHSWHGLIISWLEERAQRLTKALNTQTCRNIQRCWDLIHFGFIYVTSRQYPTSGKKEVSRSL